MEAPLDPRGEAKCQFPSNEELMKVSHSRGTAGRQAVGAKVWTPRSGRRVLGAKNQEPWLSWQEVFKAVVFSFSVKEKRKFKSRLCDTSIKNMRLDKRACAFQSCTVQVQGACQHVEGSHNVTQNIDL